MNNNIKTNLEHYKYEIIARSMTNVSKCSFLKENVLKVNTCSVISCHECTKKVEEWLQQPYEEPVVEIDWSKVSVDTPVFVWTDDIDVVHVPRYFSNYDENAERKFGCFPDGQTSFSTSVLTNTYWRYCKLARQEDIEKYRK